MEQEHLESNAISVCRPFSRIAAIVLPTARPLPFKVCIYVFFINFWSYWWSTCLKVKAITTTWNFSITFTTGSQTSRSKVLLEEKPKSPVQISTNLWASWAF